MPCAALAPTTIDNGLAAIANQRWFYDHLTQTIRDENRLAVATIGRDDPGGHEDGRLASAAPALLASLLVFCTDRRLRAWLEEHDPKALEQASRAVDAVRNG
jgi:hypothetical protein